MIEVRPVESSRELRDWCALTDRLYAAAPGFVPPMRQQLRDFHAGKAPYLRHGEIEFLSVVRDGELVGRTTAHTNAKLDAKLGAPHQLFGFTEFVDGDVLGAIAAALEARGRARGATRLFGPVNLLPNQSGGVVTAGFENRGFVDGAYNLPYYADAYERNGFTRRFAGATFIAARLQDDRRRSSACSRSTTSGSSASGSRSARRTGSGWTRSWSSCARC